MVQVLFATVGCLVGGIGGGGGVVVAVSSSCCYCGCGYVFVAAVVDRLLFLFFSERGDKWRCK